MVLFKDGGASFTNNSPEAVVEGPSGSSLREMSCLYMSIYFRVSFLIRWTFSFTNIREFPSHFHLAETRSQSIYIEGTLKPESLESALKSTGLGLFIYILFRLN